MYNKLFEISHPTKDGIKIRHESLKGPEYGIYIRGKVRGHLIQLPDYWNKLVDENTITVHLTPIDYYQSLYVSSANSKLIVIKNKEIEIPYFYYMIYAERVDVEKLKKE